MGKKRFLPPTYFNVSLLLLVLLKLVFPIAKIIYFPWNLIGLIPLIIGIYINLSADRSFKIFKTTVKPFEESSALITTGVFKYGRNPMYLGMVLILLGLATLLQSLSPYVVAPGFIFAMERVFIGDEEKMLEAKFGEEWSRYKQATRKWI
jgi:protein-S-isoprenylcysteine O-methyltransferase Ste14